MEDRAITMEWLLDNSDISSSVVSDALTDDDLLFRMQNDDETAFQMLVERHIDRAHGLALRILKNSADAEDVTQDVFVKTWTNRMAWQPGRARFSTWLYRVIVNRCIDLRRAPVNEDLDSVPEPADGATSAEDLIQQSQVHLQVEKAIARLPTQQRAAIVLSYYEEMSNAQVAEIMGTTIDAIESLLKRGRQKLREYLRHSSRDLGHRAVVR